MYVELSAAFENFGKFLVFFGLFNRTCTSVMLTRSEQAPIFYNVFYYFILQKPDLQSFSLLVRSLRGNLRDIRSCSTPQARSVVRSHYIVISGSWFLGDLRKLLWFRSVERNSDHFSRHHYFAFQSSIFQFLKYLPELHGRNATEIHENMRDTQEHSFERRNDHYASRKMSKM